MKQQFNSRKVFERKFKYEPKPRWRQMTFTLHFISSFSLKLSSCSTTTTHKKSFLSVWLPVASQSMKQQFNSRKVFELKFKYEPKSHWRQMTFTLNFISSFSLKLSSCSTTTTHKKAFFSLLEKFPKFFPSYPTLTCVFFSQLVHLKCLGYQINELYRLRSISSHFYCLNIQFSVTSLPITYPLKRLRNEARGGKTVNT